MELHNLLRSNEDLSFIKKLGCQCKTVPNFTELNLNEVNLSQTYIKKLLICAYFCLAVVVVKLFVTL